MDGCDGSNADVEERGRGPARFISSVLSDVVNARSRGVKESRSRGVKESRSRGMVTMPGTLSLLYSRRCISRWTCKVTRRALFL
jgi:hypothetical protein